jgi:hypothetical protein
MKQDRTARPKKEIDDVYDLRLAVLDLNLLGYDFELSDSDDSNAKRAYVTCKKTRNRFALEAVGQE